VVVLGNSTDLRPVFDGNREPAAPDAWPSMVGSWFAEHVPDRRVTITNASVAGGGFDIGLYGVTSQRERLEELIVSRGPNLDVLVVSPSVVDLQLRDREVALSFAAFEDLVAAAAPAFDLVLVTPMTPVGERRDPALTEAIAAFNDLLADEGYLDAAYAVSPLIVAGTDVGADAYFDDFDDIREDTPGPDPDWLHPDIDGHRAIASAVAPWLAGRLAARCQA
jgi:lysophospholipase L1-like esterase